MSLLDWNGWREFLFSSTICRLWCTVDKVRVRIRRQVPIHMCQSYITQEPWLAGILLRSSCNSLGRVRDPLFIGTGGRGSPLTSSSSRWGRGGGTSIGSPGRGGSEEDSGASGAAMGIGDNPCVLSIGVVMERLRELSQSGDYGRDKMESKTAIADELCMYSTQAL